MYLRGGVQTPRALAARGSVLALAGRHHRRSPETCRPFHLGSSTPSCRRSTLSRVKHNLRTRCQPFFATHPTAPMVRPWAYARTGRSSGATIWRASTNCRDEQAGPFRHRLDTSWATILFRRSSRGRCCSSPIQVRTRSGNWRRSFSRIRTW